MIEPDIINPNKDLKGVVPAKQLNPLEATIQAKESEKKPFWEGVDPLELAYLMIYESVQLSHNQAQIQAKSVEKNAEAQNKLIDIEGALNFYTFKQSQLFHKKTVSGTMVFSAGNNNIWTPGNMNGGGHFVFKPTKFTYTLAKVAKTLLEDMGFKNEAVSFMRDLMAGKLNVLKQNASVDETNLNTVADEGQQELSEGSSILQILVGLTNQISKI